MRHPMPSSFAVLMSASARPWSAFGRFRAGDGSVTADGRPGGTRPEQRRQGLACARGMSNADNSYRAPSRAASRTPSLVRRRSKTTPKT